MRDLDHWKLSRLDSSNCHERFNNTLRFKAQKDKHYSEGGSLANELSAAVCQKNNGYIYVAKVLELCIEQSPFLTKINNLCNHEFIFIVLF